MNPSLCDTDEVSRRGQTHYDQVLRARVAAGNEGKFLALDVASGEYEIDPVELSAIQRLRARRPDSAVYLVRIGHPAAFRLGGRFMPGLL